MRTSPLASPYLAVWAVLAVAMAAWCTWLLLPAPAVVSLMSEEGPIENGTVVLYGLAALAFWVWRDRRAPGSLWACLCTVMLAFGAREMDLHKAFTGTSVLKFSFYLGMAPWFQKVAALSVLVPLALTSGMLVLRWVRPWWAGLRARQTVAITVLTFLVTLVVSKTIDRSLNVLTQDFGLAFDIGARALQLAFEETLELSLPALALLGLLQHRLGAAGISRW